MLPCRLGHGREYWALSGGELPKSDTQHSSVGLPLLESEFPLWDSFQADVQTLRSVRDTLQLDEKNFGWMRITSLDLTRPSIEIGQRTPRVEQSSIPKRWTVRQTKAELSERELLTVAETIGTTDAVQGSRAQNAKTKTRDAISKGAIINSVSISYTDKGPKLRVGMKSIPASVTGDETVEFFEGDTPVFTDRNSTVGQFKGSTHIDTPIGGCTSNINVQSPSGDRYALTAGHCFDNNYNAGYLTSPSWVANNTVVTHDGNRIGTFVQSSARKTTYNAGGPWILDTALVKLDAASNGTNLFMWRQPGSGNPSGDNYYDNVLAGWGNPLPGEMICMEGSSTYRNNAAGGFMQTVCGSQGATVSIYDGATFVGNQYRLVPFGGVWGNETCRQDSGAIIRVPSGGASRPQGINSGLLTGGAGTVTRTSAAGSPICTSEMRWTPIWMILSALGIGPQWARGASNLRNTRTGLCLTGGLEGSCNATSPIEYVPASSASQADTMLLAANNVCSETGLATFNGLSVLAADNACNYSDAQKFEFVNVGARKFKLRNIASASFAQGQPDGRVALVPTGDTYELIG